MMRKVLAAWLLISMFAASAEAVEPDAGAPSAAVEAPAPAEKPLNKQDAALKAVLDNSEPTGEQVLAQATETTSLVKQAWQSRAATEIALALSSLLFLGLSLLRKVAGTNHLKGNAVRLTCILTGVAASLLGYYGGGFGFVESLQLFMGGIGAVAINESVKVAKRSDV